MRRSLRALCDEMGLTCKVYVENLAATAEKTDSKEIVILISNGEPKRNVVTKPLHTTGKVLFQNTRKIPPLPLYWDHVAALLEDLNDAKSCHIVANLPLMLKSKVSLSWYLLLIELLLQRMPILPEVIWKNAVSLASEQHDLFGLLEIVHLAPPSVLENIAEWNNALRNCVISQGNIASRENYASACVEVFNSHFPIFFYLFLLLFPQS